MTNKKEDLDVLNDIGSRGEPKRSRAGIDMSTVAMYGAPPVAPPDVDDDIARLKRLAATPVSGWTVGKEPVDMVNAPPHYTGHASGIEQIEVSRHMGFCLGSAWKYLFRRDGKGAPLEDLAKAVWYLRDWAKLRRLDEVKIFTEETPHTEAFFWEDCAGEYRAAVKKAHRVVSYEPNAKIAEALAFIARASFVDDDNYTESSDVSRAIAAIELEITQRKEEA